MIESCTDLPRTVEEITPEWLSRALTVGAQRSVKVTHVEITNIVWGNATKVCVSVTYDGEEPLPARLCVKGGFDDRLAKVGSPVQLVLEADFYGALAQHLHSRLPRSFYAGKAPDGSQGIVILEDLTTRDVRFVNAGESLTTDEVASGLEAQAGWHAATWDERPGRLPRVQIGGADRMAVGYFLSEKYWTRHFAQDGAPNLPAEFDARELLISAFRGLWERDDAGTHCLQHGDAHAGNTYVEADSSVVFIDWASYFLGHWAHDVAFFISGALPVDVRREHEKDLVLHYLHALRANGGPEIPMADVMADYGRHLLRGFLWAVTPPVMQPFERTRVMSERHLTAMQDHATLRLLES